MSHMHEICIKQKFAGMKKPLAGQFSKAGAVHAMFTAMKASRNIITAPTSGSTMGIRAPPPRRRRRD
jgi:hypothetical protein